MSWNKTINSYLTEVYCVCPACSSCAIVRAPRPRSEMVWRTAHARLTCTSCPLVAHVDCPPAIYLLGHDTAVAVDPYFGLELFLTTTCRSHRLFAFNPEHIRDLREFVTAPIRPRPANKKWSMVNRLPRWMKLAKNRPAVLAALRRLESRVVSLGSEPAAKAPRVRRSRPGFRPAQPSCPCGLGSRGRARV